MLIVQFLDVLHILTFLFGHQLVHDDFVMRPWFLFKTICLTPFRSSIPYLTLLLLFYNDKKHNQSLFLVSRCKFFGYLMIGLEERKLSHWHRALSLKYRNNEINRSTWIKITENLSPEWSSSSSSSRWAPRPPRGDDSSSGGQGCDVAASVLVWYSAVLWKVSL